jgi:hypothetical protein
MIAWRAPVISLVGFLESIVHKRPWLTLSHHASRDL